MEFKEILKNLRLDLALKQKEVAEACQLSPQCISQLESGERNPTGSTLVALANFFEVSTDYLLGREDDFGNVTVVDSPTHLPREEQNLLTNFRKLPSDLQHRASAYMLRLVDLYEEERQPSTVTVPTPKKKIIS